VRTVREYKCFGTTLTREVVGPLRCLEGYNLSRHVRAPLGPHVRIVFSVRKASTGSSVIEYPTRNFVVKHAANHGGLRLGSSRDDHETLYIRRQGEVEKSYWKSKQGRGSFGCFSRLSESAFFSWAKNPRREIYVGNMKEQENG